MTNELFRKLTERQISKKTKSKEAESQRRFLKSFDEIGENERNAYGGKATNLVILSGANLSVPPGFGVSVDTHEYFLKHGVLPDGLADEVIKTKRGLGGKIAIRSSANCEDGEDLTMAGVFQSKYVYKDEDVAPAIEEIYKQSQSSEVNNYMGLHGKKASDVRMGLIVQELIEPEFAGVVYTGVDGKKTLVQYVDNFGASLVDGKTRGSSILLDEEGFVAESTGYEVRPLSPTAIDQINDNSKKIASIFPNSPQDIEFAYKDGVVHILQARSLTTELGRIECSESPEDTLEATKERLKRLVAEEKRDLGTPTAIFSDANYSELLPRPKEFDIGTHMYVWGGSDGVPGAKQLGHESMGYLVGKETVPVISFIGGRTYFSIGRNAGLYHIGFPETKKEYYSSLVPEYLSAVQEDPEKGAYPQMGLYLQDPTLKDLQSRFGDRANEYYEVYKKFTKGMKGFADSYLKVFYNERLPETTAYVDKLQNTDINSMHAEQLASHAMQILEHNRTKSYVDFVNGARLGFYYSQRLQALLRQKLGIDWDEAQRLYSKLNQGLDGSAITDANLMIADAENDRDAYSIAERKIGHYSTGEMLEIRHKPLRDDPDKMRAYVAGIRQTGQYRNNFEKQRLERISTQQEVLARVGGEDRDELQHVIESSQTYMALRETAKYYLTKEYLYLRDTLELLGSRTGLEDGDIYHLYPREISQFAKEPRSMRHIIRSRKQAFANYPELNMPSVIRESDIDSLGLKTKDKFEFIEARGKFLADGKKVEGVVVNSDEFDDLRQANEAIQRFHAKDIAVILAATQMNLSHDPLIAQSEGLIIKNAGLVAHGAQRARELGKGALAGIDTDLLHTGIEISFDPESKTVKKIKLKEKVIYQK